MRLSRRAGLCAMKVPFTFHAGAITAYGGTSRAAGSPGQLGQASGFNYSWNQRLTFTPGRSCTRLTVEVKYTVSYGVMGDFKAGITASSAAELPGESVSFRFDSGTKTATITFTGRFSGEETYYLWLWRSTGGNPYYVNGITTNTVRFTGE